MASAALVSRSQDEDSQILNHQVPFPKSAQSTLSVFEVFNLNLGGLSLPLSCVGLGGYLQQMRFTIIFPIVIAAGIIFCSFMYAICGRAMQAALAVAQKSASGEASKGRALAAAKGSPLKAGGLIALPLLLTLSFLVFPTVSSTAFQAFTCEEFEDGRSFLRADYAIECTRIDHESPEHEHAKVLALIGILLYPVGVSVLYILLFRKANKAILNEKSTALSRALGFLTLDFEKEYYAWELFEAWKKLFLVGFCVLIVPGTILQLLIAFVFSLMCMLLTAVASPFKSDVDDTIGKAFGFALSSVFFFAVVIKVNVLTEAVDSHLPQQLRKNFSFNIIIVSFGMTAAVAIAFIVTAVVAVHQLYFASRIPYIKLRSRQARPALLVAKGITWHLFLSHIWGTGQVCHCAHVSLCAHVPLCPPRCSAPPALCPGSVYSLRPLLHRISAQPSSASSLCSCRASPSSLMSTCAPAAHCLWCSSP